MSQSRVDYKWWNHHRSKGYSALLGKVERGRQQYILEQQEHERFQARQELISRIEARKALKRRVYKKNPFRIIRDGILSIKTKKHGIVPLKPNGIQKKILATVEDLWFSNKPIRIMILKPRQKGSSTIVEAILYVLSGILEGFNSLVISDDKDGSNYLADMFRLYHERLKEYDPRIMPDFVKNNPNRLTFDRTKSNLYIDTARNVAAGRKYTFHGVHCSEVAFYPETVDQMMLGLLNTIGFFEGTFVCMESTANGVGNYFHRMWEKAVSGTSSWLPLFFAWWEDPDFRLKFDCQEQVQHLLSTMDREERNLFQILKKECNEKEQVVLEMLNRRRFCIENECGGSVEKFHQEYPSSWEEAFLTSGRGRFNNKVLRNIRTDVKEPEKRGTMYCGVWEDNEVGDIRIWEEPKEHHKYVMGVDPAVGRIVAANDRKTDAHCAQILDVATLALVAQVHAHDMDIDYFGEFIYQMGKKYNNAFIGIENNRGQTLITYMKERGYTNLYQNIVYDEYTDREQSVIGWCTNTKTKRLLIDELAAFIRNRDGYIPDTHTINELFSFMVNDKGECVAQEGCHDDRVMALAIAVQMLKHINLQEHSLIKPEEIPHTWAWERKKILEQRKQLTARFH